MSEAPDSDGGGGEADEFVEPPEGTKLFVGNLPYDVDSHRLVEIFLGAGTVDMVEVWSTQLS